MAAEARAGTGVLLATTTKDSVAQVRALISAALPVRYADGFYTALVDGSRASLEARLTAEGPLVGHAAWMMQEINGAKDVYLLDLVVDARYRRSGIGSGLVGEAIKDGRCKGAGRIILHVQTTNEDALAFYAKLGFRIIDTITNYYSVRVVPPDAHLVALSICHDSGTT